MASPPLGTVTVTVNDNGASAAVAVPLSSLQLKIGCCVAPGTGTVATIMATQSPSALQTALVAGPLLEAAGIVCNNGGTVVVATCPVATKGTATAPVAGASNVGNAVLTAS